MQTYVFKLDFLLQFSQKIYSIYEMLNFNLNDNVSIDRTEVYPHC